MEQFQVHLIWTILFLIKMKKQNPSKKAIFVEGETEEKLVKALFKIKCKKFNLWNVNPQKLEASLRVLQDLSEVYILIDTDEDITLKMHNFVCNIKALIKNKIKVHILVQTYNFEDELCYSMNLKKEKMIQFFNADNIKVFKNNFLKENDLLVKLNKIGFKVEKLWNRANLNEKVKDIPNIADIISIDKFINDIKIH